VVDYLAAATAPQYNWLWQIKYFIKQLQVENIRQ
jgi:hypothetical protein